MARKLVTKEELMENARRFLLTDKFKPRQERKEEEDKKEANPGAEGRQPQSEKK